ncbi:MAG: DNA polymerase III subunit gamma/tau [Clostridia bacterium]|nr:DNA polymerase III subunit gamma/tau [Clostridia bacterium]
MYQALYRKWRPKLFSDVVGQDHVTRTLQNEVKLNRIGHAYLFIGSRGTGKTSCAKIFAKAVNCLKNVDGNPCGECEICKEIENAEIMDIVELDAASNNGVNDIREVCESAAFTPAKAKYRVYIIDEVHMLSQGAFNALLKTLEEPPSYVMFILATTEAHKIPATILSRCQRFEFHKIKSDNIKSRLRYISQEEGIELSEQAASIIARLADGAMRDALTILDKCMGVTNNVTETEVSSVVGIEDSKKLLGLADAIINQKLDEALKSADDMNKGSKNFAVICEEMIAIFRNLMIVKSIDNPRELMIVSDEDYIELRTLADCISLEKVLNILDSLSSSLNKMSKISDPKIEFEMCLVKLCSPELNLSVFDLSKRMDQMEVKLKNKGSEVDFKMNADSKKSEPEKTAHRELQAENQNNTTANPENSEDGLYLKNEGGMQRIFENAILMDNWNKVLEALGKYSPTIAVAFKDSKAYLSDPFVLIDSKNEVAFELLRRSSRRDKMRLAIKEVTGKNYKLGPYRPMETAPKEKDVLVELAENARKLGVKVNTK